MVSHWFLAPILLLMLSTQSSAAAYTINPYIGTTTTTIGDCCENCDCQAEKTCDSCATCRWDQTECTPIGDQVNPCCRTCTCTSWQECLACGCCLASDGFTCRGAPCTNSTTTTTPLTYLRPSTTSTTMQQRVRTTSTTTTTYRRLPNAGDILAKYTSTTRQPTATTDTTYTTTTTQATVKTSTSTTTTSATNPPPSCTDGKINQGEDWIDCGGPCELCPQPAVTVSIKNPKTVETGTPFNVTVTLQSNRTGKYSVALKLPPNLYGRVKAYTNVPLKTGEPKEVTYLIESDDTTKAQEYEMMASVLDQRRVEVAANRSVVQIVNPKGIIGKIEDLLGSKGARWLQDRVFFILNNTTHMITDKAPTLAMLIFTVAACAYYLEKRTRRMWGN